MRVDIDEPGRDDAAHGLEHRRPERVGDPLADGDNPAVLHEHVTATAPGRVDDGPAAHDDAPPAAAWGSSPVRHRVSLAGPEGRPLAQQGPGPDEGRARESPSRRGRRSRPRARTPRPSRRGASEGSCRRSPAGSAAPGDPGRPPPPAAPPAPARGRPARRARRAAVLPVNSTSSTSTTMRSVRSTGISVASWPTTGRMSASSRYGAVSR